VGNILVGGELIAVDGLTVIGPHQAAWVYLDAGDGCPRSRNAWVRQFILHKTIADDPEYVIPGAGATGADERTAEDWEDDPRHAGAHACVGYDGRVAQLADYLLEESYHATVSNPYSVGVEMCEVRGGGVYRATLQAAVALTIASCRALGIQLQHRRSYNGQPLRRMLNGGPDCVGIFGHRDNTTDRGRWDPGDVIFAMLRAAGSEDYDFDAGEDLAQWRKRQTWLVSRGHALDVDGIPGRETLAALKAEGFVDGLWALGRPDKAPVVLG